MTQTATKPKPVPRSKRFVGTHISVEDYDRLEQIAAEQDRPLASVVRAAIGDLVREGC